MSTQQMRDDADVLVVGCGASGIPAAVAAARAGASVIAVEEDPYVGGAATDFFVTMFCGGPLTGVLAEAQARMERDYAPVHPARWYMPEAFLRTYSKLLTEAGVRVIAGAKAAEVIVENLPTGPSVRGIVIDRGGKREAIRARVTIDATGSGAVALMAGAQAMYGEEATTEYDEPSAPEKASQAVQHLTWMYLSQQLKEGPCFNMMQLDNVRRGILVHGLGWFHNDPEKAMALNPRIFLHWGCQVPCTDTRDPVCLADSQREALALMERDHVLLRENGYAIHLAPRIGVREQSRILGETVVTEKDLRSGMLPPDAIAYGTYGIDIWGRTVGTSTPSVCKAIPGYGIPYRALIPRGVEGLLVAGKAISGTHIAMSAYRVMPIVGSIGQAAGVAAALAAGKKGQPRGIASEEIVRCLSSMGMAIPFPGN